MINRDATHVNWRITKKREPQEKLTENMKGKFNKGNGKF